LQLNTWNKQQPRTSFKLAIFHHQRLCYWLFNDCSSSSATCAGWLLAQPSQPAVQAAGPHTMHNYRHRRELQINVDNVPEENHDGIANSSSIGPTQINIDSIHSENSVNVKFIGIRELEFF
jgi:hypothetical protein